MISFLESTLPYISGLYTLPWILIGFVATIILSKLFSAQKVDFAMKKTALILLYFFVPILIFRIFLDTALGKQEILYIKIVILSIFSMYMMAYAFARYQIKKQQLSGAKRTLYLKTIITNQGRSSAFVGGIMLMVPSWGVPVGIFMALVGVALFAVIPYILCHMKHEEGETGDNKLELPWFLKFYPYYFLAFVIAGVLIQKLTGITSRDLGSFGIVLRFYTATTIPAALYYVGSGIHPTDMRKSELRKIVGLDYEDGVEHWPWVRQIFTLTSIITPLVFAIVFGTLSYLRLIPPVWFAVIFINSVLPITSTNMFLIPYGIDRRATAHSVTWSTLICVPVVVALIAIFSAYYS